MEKFYREIYVRKVRKVCVLFTRNLIKTKFYFILLLIDIKNNDNVSNRLYIKAVNQNL